MSLSSLYLDAFAEVARQKSFSLAAQKLNITQSALSQRVLNLEQELGSTLFVRESSGIRMTDLGQKLLRYCQNKESLESEFLGHVKNIHSKALSGIVRIGCFSTVTTSVVLPTLNKIFKSHPQVHIEIKESQIRYIPALLTSGSADFIFLNQALQKQGIENHHVGFEENILVQSSAHSEVPDLYFDHDEDDMTTFEFFRSQGKRNPRFQRNFLSNNYALTEAVQLGMGKAILPKHILKNTKGLEGVKGYDPQKIPVHFCHYHQPFYTDLQKYIIEQFKIEIPKILRPY